MYAFPYLSFFITHLLIFQEIISSLETRVALMLEMLIHNFIPKLYNDHTYIIYRDYKSQNSISKKQSKKCLHESKIQITLF